MRQSSFKLLKFFLVLSYKCRLHDLCLKVYIHIASCEDVKVYTFILVRLIVF